MVEGGMVLPENTQPISKLIRTVLFLRLSTAHQNGSGNIVFWPVSLKSVILYIIWVMVPLGRLEVFFWFPKNRISINTHLVL